MRYYEGGGNLYLCFQASVECFDSSQYQEKVKLENERSIGQKKGRDFYLV